MADTDYSSMLNLTYELEGLLVLLGQRDDEYTGSIRQLAIEKVEQIRRMMVGESSEPSCDRTRQTGPQDDPELKEIEQMPDAPEVAPLREGKGETENEITTKDKTEAAEDRKDPEEPKGVATANDRPSPTKDSSLNSRPLSFTLNDKFRFRRELFANNDIEFSDTINVLAAMSNMAEAEDYLYNDLCWDPSNEDVQAFIAILAEHFPN